MTNNKSLAANGPRIGAGAGRRLNDRWMGTNLEEHPKREEKNNNDEAHDWDT
jgi:hypothetical protein